ncbi:MAG TPA: translation initiation factor IF-2 [Nitrososphaeraceae archaeon]|nr:translation initiation factor IF-2 [Nitrososphaeraceae archaeon]
MKLRQPVLVVLGHVDSGKTSLLDTIRGTGVQAREAGGITQHIGASFFPIDTIKQLTGPLYEKLAKSESPIPGLLVIDTPGHEVFANLRSRGGSAADIAIVVVDANKGFEPQTFESMEILKKRRVPFVIALNKVDMIAGWRRMDSPFITEQVRAQDPSVTSMLDERIYNVVGSLSRLGYNSEGFWRVKDFTKEVAIVPVSAAKNIGIPELLAVVVGLSQQFMTKRLQRIEGPGRGIILEINEEIGLGPSANLVLIDGTLRVGETIMVAKRDKAVTTKIKALLLPKPLDEMRDPRDKFKPVTEVTSAAGVKITSPDLDGVLAGSPLYVLRNKEEEKKLKSIIEEEINSTIIADTNTQGIILRCDTIGSLEAIRDMLRKEDIPIQKADIGHITRRDVLAASAVKEKNRYLGVILGFNIKILEEANREAQERGIPIFSERIIYNLVRNYTDWVNYQKEHEESILFNEIPPICRFQFMKGFVFRRNYPAVFGAEILIGKLRQKVQVINEVGKKIGAIHQIQKSGKPIDEATQGEQVAVSIKEISIGRHINEGDIFYTDLKSKEAKLLSERFSSRLTPEEKDLLDKIIAMKRSVDPSYAYI